MSNKSVETIDISKCPKHAIKALVEAFNSRANEPHTTHISKLDPRECMLGAAINMMKADKFLKSSRSQKPIAFQEDKAAILKAIMGLTMCLDILMQYSEGELQ